MTRFLRWTSGLLLMLLGISVIYPELTAQVLSHATPDISLFANWMASHVMGTGADGVAMAGAAVAIATTDLNDLKQSYGEKLTEQRTLLDKAKAEKRELTADEDATYRKLDTDVMAIELQISGAEERERRITSLEQREGKVTEIRRRVPPTTHAQDEPVDRDRPSGRRSIMDELREVESPDVVAKLEPLAKAEYRKAFAKNLLRGYKSLSAEEQRALSVGTASEGGNTVPLEEFRAELIKAIDNQAVIRTIARVFTVTQAQGLGVPTLSADPADPDWTSEIETGSEDSNMAFGKREIHPWPLAKRIKVSKKLLRASVLGMEALVRDRLGYKLGMAQSAAFNTGTGANRPLGIFTASADGIPTTRDVEIGNGSGAVDADKLIEGRYTLKQGYAVDPSARWVMHRLWLARLRKLKATTGDYVWQPGLTRGDPTGMTLLDVPVVLDENSPSVTTHAAGVYAAVLGAFQFYWIVDALGVEIERLDQLYAESNQMGFISRAETDGMPVLSEAFVRLIAAT